MTETQHPRRIVRSIVALLTGIFAGVILTVVTDIVLHVTGVFPPWGQPTGDALLLLATAYRIPFNIAGSYVVARLAPDRPMQHALVSGVVGVVAGTVGAVTKSAALEYPARDAVCPGAEPQLTGVANGQLERRTPLRFPILGAL